MLEVGGHSFGISERRNYGIAEGVLDLGNSGTLDLWISGTRNIGITESREFEVLEYGDWGLDFDDAEGGEDDDEVVADGEEDDDAEEEDKKAEETVEKAVLVVFVIGLGTVVEVDDGDEPYRYKEKT